MSRGYGGYASKVIEDEDWVIYEYGAFNLNKAQYQNNEKVYDGNFMIAKSIFVKDKVVLKRKKLPTGGHRFVEKRLKINVFDAVINGILTENICIVNSRYEWDIKPIGEQEVGNISLLLLYKLFESYRDQEQLPEHVCCFS
ncbi:hypothetical protein [Staphylococcus simulans]|uniref:hypothetical protein n=1 Tax=Staphylococcus simulans TaxID=1286 RepID=UPI00399AA33A